jgi:hypothetical protein
LYPLFYKTFSKSFHTIYQFCRFWVVGEEINMLFSDFTFDDTIKCQLCCLDLKMSSDARKLFVYDHEHDMYASNQNPISIEPNWTGMNVYSAPNLYHQALSRIGPGGTHEGIIMMSNSLYARNACSIWWRASFIQKNQTPPATSVLCVTTVMHTCSRSGLDLSLY